MEQEPITPSSGRRDRLVKLLLTVLVVVLFGWDLLWWALGVQPIFPWQLNWTLKETPDYYRLIDTRTSWEYERFHIRGARRYPFLQTLSHPGHSGKEDFQKPTVVICFSGHRSALAAFKLRQQGFSKVYNLTWGMAGWVLSGGETVSGPWKESSSLSKPQFPHQNDQRIPSKPGKNAYAPTLDQSTSLCVVDG